MMKRIKLYLTLILLVTTVQLNSQTIYKTPSGSKYHLASCRMVENVSKKIVDPKSTNLTPCSFCKPPSTSNLVSSLTSEDKSSGRAKTTQCKGIAKSTGRRCKHMTSIGNGYCYQHTSQDRPNTAQKSSKSQSSSSGLNYTPRCGARTKSGKSCRRKVKGGGRCYQHGG